MIQELLTEGRAKLEPCDITEFAEDAGLRLDEVALPVRTYFTGLPVEDTELGPFTILSPASVYQEARQLLPSCGVVSHGFLTFAREAAGDLFVVQLSTGTVYLLNHDIYLSETWIEPRYEPNLMDSGFPERLPVTAETIIATAEGKFESIEEFFAALT